jgi:hypothetical protein
MKTSLDFTPFLRIYSHYRRSLIDNSDYGKLQEQTLLGLIKKAQDTEFGRQHAFASIHGVSDYQKKVPLRTYEEFWEHFWKPRYPNLRDCTWPGLVRNFCVSSGTSSGKTKYIPCTDEMIASNSTSGLELLCHHTFNRKYSSLLRGKSFFLGGSTNLSEEAPGIFCGDLSGIQAANLPWWAQAFYFPPKELALLSNWEEKISQLAEAAIKEDIRLIGGVPSWLLIFFDKVFQITKCSSRRIVDAFPNLELLVHGGVNFAPYATQFARLLEGSRAETREVYPASEGFVAIADRSPGEGMLLNLNNDIFFEFVPVEELDREQPTRHWVGNIEKGVQYAIALTTCAGLWSYLLGDTVSFVETSPPRLLVTGRTSYMLSAFGEHLIGAEIEQAVAKAAQSIQNNVKEYAVGPVFPSEETPLGGHIYIVEFEDPLPAGNLKKFLSFIDEYLAQINEDYEAHRAQGYGLNPPAALVVEAGCFVAWMKSRGKLGGQHKVPRVINDSELLENLIEFAKTRLIEECSNVGG